MKGTLYYVRNYELAVSMLNPLSKIVSLDETIGLETPEVIKATCLLPPPSAMIAESDGRAQDFYNIYKGYLATDMVSEFINTMICYMFSGGNFLLYIPTELQSSAFVPFLFQHMFEVYGLKVGTEVEPFYYDNSHDPINFNIVYDMGVMDAYTYLSVYPIPLYQIEPYSANIIITKLYNELQPVMPFGKTQEEFNEVLKYFENLRIMMKQNPNIRQGIVFE